MAHVDIGNVTVANVDIRPIRRLLVANRGEIARRIMRSAHAMGISTVAVYADSDAAAPFVREADIAIALRGASSRETYLDVSKVLAACERAGADAVHPGYGFLSENAAFAEAVVERGLTWVGPSPDAIRHMGDKLAAKRLIQEADVPTLAAIELKRGTDASAAAREIGFPVLVKAAAGGGGRGMRIVENEAALADAISSAGREALAAFGDGTLFLERWLRAARHVEVQILGDRHGNLVHLFERECSIQRRHQKVIEEAPSPAVDDELRARLGQAALAVAQRMGYASAGTVEFLLDGREFWFLEVNTRLQVEHPVTEAITGLDLVREQLRIAEGEPLGYGQNDLRINGHAIEARLYAEDPRNSFLPAPGRVAVWTPALDAGARFDSGIESGSEIGIEFDPMLAKVIVHAPTRREAASRLARVLENTRIQGITHNRDFLVASLRTPAFLAGDTTTDFIERVAPPRSREVTAAEQAEAAIAVAMLSQQRNRQAAQVLTTMRSGWRNSLMPRQTLSFTFDGVELDAAYEAQRDGSFKVRIKDQDHAVRLHACAGDRVELEIDGVRIAKSIMRVDDRWLVHGGCGDVELKELPRFPLPQAAEFRGGLYAPMPGKVLATHVAAGDRVTSGQLLLVLEAMKMEHRITAPVDGLVKRMDVVAGDQVSNGQMLVVLEEQEK